ncbi:lasso peptide biosynthesis protein [uncultured Thiohalocapsa sp.]|uniref:lasso peptide biosynthesis protein n=1 Tax=uncultured Thiohalocapsa sp. TaxID=768990 RepID=UPI0025E115C2|nr:lasso peptide biosynthesis protein [uncultured Thiohalocapsa sp.]
MGQQWRKVMVAALLLWALIWALASLAAVRASEVPAASLVVSLAPAVEDQVALTRPQHWPMKRACLYYALAGQALLAEHGIPARLRVGRVVYRPGSDAAHAIAPHVWLETPAAFIDYATLPRWGRVSVIPRALVAAAPAQVVAGRTPVLAVAAPADAALVRWLSHHARRFQTRAGSACAPQPAPAPCTGPAPMGRPAVLPSTPQRMSALPAPMGRGCGSVWLPMLPGCCRRF